MPAPADLVTARTAARVAALLAGRPPRAAGPRVLAVDGPSGAGGTSIAGAVVAALAADALPTALVHLDDLYPGWDGLAEVVPVVLHQVLEPLSAGAPAAYRLWDWEASRWAGSVAVPPAEVVVVEGVGSGSRACAPHLDLLVWVEAPREERMRRGVERDGEAYRPHWERWARQETALFAAEGTRERADVRLRTA